MTPPGARTEISGAEEARAGRAPDRAAIARVGVIIAAMSALVVWSHWPTFAPMALNWWHDPNYSIGMLVPFAALYLAWIDRVGLASCRVAPSWWGAVVVLLAQALRLYGLITLRESLERYGLVLTMIGVVLLIAGRQVFRRSLGALLLLFRMGPLPGGLHNLLAAPLQRLAASGAAFVLELVGVMVTREGTVITLSNLQRINVEEACSGLRMLTAFVVVAWVMACLVHRPVWQKVALVVSSVPVAMVCNLLRLVVTALLFLAVGTETAEWFFHEAGGWAMMVLAVGLLWGELWLMSRLLCEEDDGRIRTEM